MANCQVSVVENTAYVLSSLFEKVKKIQEKNRKEKERENGEYYQIRHTRSCYCVQY